MGVKVGFIGCGGIAGRHLESLMKVPQAELVAFSDIAEDKARKFAETAGGGEVFGNPIEMLDAVELDAVYICLPPHVHGEPEKACLSRRIPFFVEKPLGNDLGTVTDILGTIRRMQAMTAVGYMGRYRRSFQRGRELLRGQKISNLEAHWIGGTPGAPWWRLKEQSGGQLVEQTTHLIDAIAYLVGRVTEVYAVGAVGTHAAPPEGYNIEDATSLTLKFANGAVGSVNSCCTVTNGSGGVGLKIYSPAVTLDYGQWNMTLTATKGKDETEVVEGEDNIFEIEATFIKAVETGDASHIRCDYGQAYHAHQITMAANKSLETGAPVKLGM